MFSKAPPKFLPTIQKQKHDWNYYHGGLLTERKRTALVVDDGAMSRRVCSTVLLELGYEVDFSDNGRNAVDRICPVNPSTEDEVLEKTYDVIIMDCFMSVIDGLDTVAALRLGGYTGAIVGLSYDTLDDYSKRFRYSAYCLLLRTFFLSSNRSYPII
jgi:CheY-like chemotaxis protein